MHECGPPGNDNADAHRLHTAREILAQLPPGGVDAIVSGVVGLARQGEKGIQPALLAKLATLDPAKLDERLTLDLLRAYQVVFTRTGEPDKAAAAKL